MIKRLFFLTCMSFVCAVSVMLISCTSIFSGGTGGIVVDADSKNTTKTGIANVDVFAYTSQSDRDSDFNRWNNGTKAETFKPSSDYYGHTTTGTDGTWTINKLVWKEKKPAFGKDADFIVIYLIYYHSDYGCEKDETVIISDSTSSNTYKELTSIVKRSNITLNFIDAKTSAQTSESVYAELYVPQKTDSNPNASNLVYSGVYTGSGTISIRYPRYLNESGVPTYTKTNKENVPQIRVNYYQAKESENVTWKACKQNIAENDFSFYTDEVGRGCAGLTKTLEDSPYSLTLVGKAVKFEMPSFSGTWGDTTLEERDGLHLLLKGKDSQGNYSIDLGETYTVAQNRGNNGSQTHGYFSGLGGASFEWRDYAYTGRNSEYMVRFEQEDGTVIKELTIRNDKNEYVLTF